MGKLPDYVDITWHPQRGISVSVDVKKLVKSDRYKEVSKQVRRLRLRQINNLNLENKDDESNTRAVK